MLTEVSLIYLKLYGDSLQFRKIHLAKITFNSFVSHTCSCMCMYMYVCVCLYA